MHLSTWLRILGNSETILVGCIFSGLVHLISQLDRFADIFLGAHYLFLLLVSVCGTAGWQAFLHNFFSSMAPGIQSVLAPINAPNQLRQIIVLQAALQKTRMLVTCCHLLSHSLSQLHPAALASFYVTEDHMML